MRGHISDRFVRNSTCVECDELRGHKANSGIDLLPHCRICGAQVRAHGHATCSATCQKVWEASKARAKREQNKPKHCHGCGAVHTRYYKRFCSDHCYMTHRKVSAAPKQSEVMRECIVCGTMFAATPVNKKICSVECSKTRALYQSKNNAKRTTNWREHNRRLRAKTTAAVELARNLGIEPRPKTDPTKPGRRSHRQSAPNDESWLFDFMQMRKRTNQCDVCLACGCRLSYRGGRGRQPTKFCSMTCRYIYNVYKARYENGLATCPHCGVMFWRIGGHKRYCTSACRKAAELEYQRQYDRNKRNDQEYRELKRRRERKRTAIKIAFEQLGLLSTGERT